jgi:PTH2 family peptidyl-tRNA hydrolase
MSVKQVIVLRKDLNMRRGKCVAQGAHASMGAILKLAKRDEHGMFIPHNESIWSWLAGSFTKVCVTVNSEEELLALEKAATDAGILNCLIKDAGLTEFKGQATYTALAVGPGKSEDIDKITGTLPLY